MRRRLPAPAVLLACLLTLTACADEPDPPATVNITSQWKKHFTASDQPDSWQLYARDTKEVTLADNYLNIEGAITNCEDTRVYWQMGLKWAKDVDKKVSDFVSVYSGDKLAGDTTTTGEFDCHL